MDQDITLEVPREVLTETLLTLRRVPNIHVQVKSEPSKDDGSPTHQGRRAIPSMMTTAAEAIALAIAFVPTATAITDLATKLYDLWQKIRANTSNSPKSSPSLKAGNLTILVVDYHSPEALAGAITAALHTSQSDKTS